MTVSFIDFGAKILYNIKCIGICLRFEFQSTVYIDLFFNRKSDFMLLNLFRSSFNTGYIIQILLLIPIFLLSLSVHESAHGLAANALGDPTAKNLGRITLNPVKHFDLFGFIAMLLFGFGWAKPVPINTRYMQNGKWGFVWSSLAGPLSNFILAFVFALLMGFAGVVMSYTSISPEVELVTTLFFYIGVTVNVSLAVFNLLPVPPLDGSRLLTALLPRKWAMWTFRYEQYIMYALLLLLYFGAFTGIISVAKGFVEGFIFKIVGLIPFEAMYA